MKHEGGRESPWARNAILAGLVFPRTTIADELNKGVLVVYLCAYKGTGNKCSYYLVKSCNVAINACNLVFFLTRMLFWFSLKRKDKKKKRKVNRAKLVLDVKKNFLHVIIIRFLSVHIFCSE